MKTNLAELLTEPSLDQVRSLTTGSFQALNDLIERELESDVLLINEIGQYIIGSGGKRLRPLVVMLVAKACSYRGNDHIKLSALVEFLHTATLLHDDVVDSSTLRRNRRTANAIWGNPASILVGDFLYSRAFELMVDIGSIQLMAIISEATNCIAEGEVLQLQNVGNVELGEAEYLEIIRRKTAMLFQAAAHTGAVLAGADDATARSFRDFGLYFGLAYQLIDDWLDYAGSSDSMGKNVGDDLGEGKATLPLIHAMSKGSALDATRIRTALLNRSTDDLSSVIQAVQDSGALAYTRSKAEHYTEQCLHALSHAPKNAYSAGLEALANIAVCRMK